MFLVESALKRLLALCRLLPHHSHNSRLTHFTEISTFCEHKTVNSPLRQAQGWTSSATIKKANMRTNACCHHVSCLLTNRALQTLSTIMTWQLTQWSFH